MAAMIFKLPPQFERDSMAAKVYLALFSASLSASLETTQRIARVNLRNALVWDITSLI